MQKSFGLRGFRPNMFRGARMERGKTSAFSPAQRYSEIEPLLETPPVATYSIIDTPGFMIK